MIKLFVLDFDKTLIPYDSWNMFIRMLFKKHPLKIGFILLLRKVKLINRKELKRKVTDFVERRMQLEELSQNFIQQVSKDVKLPSCLFADEGEKEIIVLSASPMIYMRHLGTYLKCQCEIVGSDYINGEYVEMCGEQKRKYLENHYHFDRYMYEYALSDSESDMIWMKLFNKYELKK